LTKHQQISEYLIFSQTKKWWRKNGGAVTHGVISSEEDQH